MNSERKKSLLKISAIILLIAALALLVLGVLMIYYGTNPPPGGGSLAHVGLVVFGIGSAFMAFVFGLLALYFYLKTRPPKGDDVQAGD